VGNGWCNGKTLKEKYHFIFIGMNAVAHKKTFAHPTWLMHPTNHNFLTKQAYELRVKSKIVGCISEASYTKTKETKHTNN
jgi:hypothetical protein